VTNVSMSRPRRHEMRSFLRQLRQPREFRINPQPLSPEVLAEIKELIAHIPTAVPAQSRPGPEQGSSEGVALLAAVGVGLWRIRKKLVDPATGQPPEPMRRAFRHLDALWNTLSDSGFQIQDHTGEMIPRGGSLSIKIIAFQPTPGTSRDYVLETIKPSLIYRGQLVQMAEVVVATPVLEPQQESSRIEP